MISLDKEQIYLLELIKASLFGKTPEIPEDANWEKIFELANSQCVVPLIESYVPLEFKSIWSNVSYLNKAHFLQVIHEQNSLVQLFKENNIPLAILKGTAAGIYYPNPSLRCYGDIDFYVSNEYFDSAKCLLDNSEYTFVSNNERQYVYEKNGVEFELHKKFSSKNYINNIDHILINGHSNLQIYRIFNFSFPGLSTYENGVILLGHIMQHIKENGVGLRQIIDWMMFVQKELEDFAWDNHFKKLASEAGLEKLAITVTYMCKKWLGLPKDITWCNTADKDVADRLLVRILSDGNFGRERVPYENIRKDIKKEGLFRFLQHTGLSNWRLAQKHAIFRPFAWLYQIFKYAGLGIAGLFTGKKVFGKDKQNLKLEELWKRLE